MKCLKAFVVVAVAVSSFPVFAQQADASAQQSAAVSAGSSQSSESGGANASASRHGASAEGYGSASNANAVNNLASSSSAANGSAAGAADMRPINGELVGKLDSKTARVGDPVIVKTTDKTRTADGTVIPKGSRLVGHVTQVQAHGKGSQESELGLAFDRAELKNGQSMPIRSVIESVSPSAAAANMAASGDDDLFASGPAPAVGGGGARSGGGLIGGGSHALAGGGSGSLAGAGSLTGVSANAVGSAAGNAGGHVGSTAGGALNSTGSTALGAGNGTLRGAAAGAGSLGAHATAIPGVMLAGDASGAASGMLSASHKNVHLDSGTQMVLGVASAVNR